MLWRCGGKLGAMVISQVLNGAVEHESSWPDRFFAVLSTWSEMTYRETIIRDNLVTIRTRQDLLTPWEVEFFESIEKLPAHLFSSKQFNRVQEIAQNLKRKELLG